MLRTVQHSSNTLSNVIEQFDGVLHSFFFEPVSPPDEYPNFGHNRMHGVVLGEFIAELMQLPEASELGTIDPGAAARFALLHRFEFEGALVQLLLGGTVTTKMIGSVDEARHLARALLAEVAGPEEASVIAYRMEDGAWTELSRGISYESSFVVYVPDLRRWWILVLADDY